MPSNAQLLALGKYLPTQCLLCAVICSTHALVELVVISESGCNGVVGGDLDILVPFMGLFPNPG